MNTTNTSITNDTVNYKTSKNEVFTFIFISVILYNVYKYVLYNCFNDLYLIFKTKIKNFLKKKKASYFFSYHTCIDTKNKCLICLGDNNDHKTSLKCKHVFHKKCITQWYLSNNHNNNNCPICREEIIP